MEELSEDKKRCIEEYRQKLSDYIKQNNKNQTKLAKELGVSATTLSLFMSGTYKGNNEEMAKKVEQLLRIGAVRQALAKSPEICTSLSNTEKILEKVQITHATNDIMLLYGAAGCGKTTALKHYAEKTNGVIYVEADVTTNSHRSILSLILECMGEKAKGSTSEMMRRIIKKLKGTNVMLIIDEAQHLTSKTFDAIRAINDKAGVSIVYSGNPSILNRMYGRSAEELDQVHSRIGFQCPLKNIYSLDDIREIFKGYNLTNECLQYLRRVSHRKGGLRVMIKQYKLAANIAAALNEDFDILHLDEAAKRMGIINDN